MLGIIQPAPLEQMQPQEAVEFLFNRTSCNRGSLQEQNAACELAAELGYLPLALEQAGAYIARHRTRIQAYLKSYHLRQLTLLEQCPPVIGNYLASVATVWNLNFEQVEEESTASADLLLASAFLSPDVIPYELLQQGGEHLGYTIATALGEQDKDPLALNELLNPLARYSLIRCDPSGQSYSIHRLVQKVVKVKLDEDSYRLWSERAVRTVAHIFPNPHEYANWPRCDSFLMQAQVAVQTVQQLQFKFEVAVRLLIRTGFYLEQRGRYSEAEPLFLQALSLRESLLGKNHIKVANILNLLGVLYNNQGRYSEAKLLFLQALEMREKLLKAMHPDIAISLNNLALLYKNQGRYVEAEPLFVQALEMSRCILGKEHSDVAQTLNNLAGLYDNQGRYSEAEPLYEQALEMRKNILGREHPEVAQSINNLALLYRNQGRYDEAEPLFLQALEMSRCILGKEHPYVAAILNNLAGLYRYQDRNDEAELSFVQALEMSKYLLGEEHPTTQTISENLRLFHQKMTTPTSILRLMGQLVHFGQTLFRLNSSIP